MPASRPTAARWSTATAMLGVARRPICCAASIWPGNESDEAARAGDTARCVQLWGRRFRLPTDCFTVPSEIIHAETSCPVPRRTGGSHPIVGSLLLHRPFGRPQSGLLDAG